MRLMIQPEHFDVAMFHMMYRNKARCHVRKRSTQPSSPPPSRDLKSNVKKMKITSQKFVPCFVDQRQTIDPNEPCLQPPESALGWRKNAAGRTFENKPRNETIESA